jgi:small subunit ribosomal protein S16
LSKKTKNVKIVVMSVVIRLSRMGKRGERKFRIVVSEKRSRRDGDPVETLGSYEMGEKNGAQNLKKDRYNYWLSVGARPSATVAKIFK